MMNRTLAQKARKKLLKRGREILRAADATPESLAELAELHAALERIERGSYGRCDRCYTEIELDRLEASARERYCESCERDEVCADVRVAPSVTDDVYRADD